MALTAPRITPLSTVLAGLATGLPDISVTGTKQSGPTGIESIIEYKGPVPILLNVVDWVDTFLVGNIDGLDGADLRQSATPNPGEDGETPGETLWGGRTLVMSGDLLARTVWKMRDMSAGIRGSFYSDVNSEYPLIFHALDPNNDLFISCKVNDKIRITDQQQAKGSSDRKWQISLRASNPRFLSVVQLSQSVTSTLSYIDFQTVSAIYIEDMTAHTLTGVSAGYTEVGNAVSPGSGFMLPKAVVQNFVVNPQAKVNTNKIAGFVNGVSAPLTAENFGGIGPRGNTCVGLKGTLSSSGVTDNMEIRFLPDDSSAYKPVVGGEMMRVSGWLMQKSFTRNGPRTVSVYLRFFQGAPGASSYTQQVKAGDLVPMAGDLDPDTGVPLVMQHQNVWYPFNFEVEVPASVGPAWVGVGCYVTGISALTNMEFYAGDVTLDYDRDIGSTLMPEFIDGDKYGCMWEGTTLASPSRRVYPVANKIWDPAGRVLTSGRPSLWTPAVGFDVGHPWQMVTNEFISGAPNVKRFLRLTGATTTPGPSIGIQHSTTTDAVTTIDVIPSSSYTFSFYLRTPVATTPRNLSVVFTWTPLNIGGQMPTAPPTTVALGAEQNDDTWRRYSCTVAVPANVLKAASVGVLITASAGNLTAGEVHDIGAFMLSPGTVLEPYVDAYATDDSDSASIPAAYVDGDSTIPNQSAVFGPIADINRVINSDFETGTFGMSAQNSALTTAATGGVDNQQYLIATYTGGAKPNYGCTFAFGTLPGNPSSFSCYARLGIPGVQRQFVIEVDHIGAGSVVLDAVDSGVVMLNDQWTLISLEDVVVPAGTTNTRVYLIELNPVNGDVLHIDKVIGVNDSSVPTFFDGTSEFGEFPIFPNTSPDTLNYSYRFHTQREITSRQFTECEQIVKFIPYAGRTTINNEIHMALSYFDEDHQLFARINHIGLLTEIVKRDDGVETVLAVQNSLVPPGLSSANTYWMRAWMTSGAVYLTVSTDDPDNPAFPNSLSTTIATVTYALTDVEKAKWQDTLSNVALAVQERGGLWKIDEWRYRSLSDLGSAWKFYRGAGVVVSDGDKLRPLVNGQQVVMTKSDLAFKIADAVMSYKTRFETAVANQLYQPAAVLKLLDSSNWIEARVRAKATTTTGAFDSVEIIKVDNGIESVLAFVQNTPMQPAQDNWVRGMMVGNVITAQRWLTDPTLGGAPTETLNFTLIGADAVKFGTGVKGEVGIDWKQWHQTSRIDDFRVTISSFNDIAYNLINKGTYKAQTTIKLTGPMTDPVITNLATGESTVISGTIPTGETWIIQNSNNTKRFYRKSDGAPLFAHWDATSMWLHIAPNSIVNPIQLSATGLDVGWDVEIDYRHTYM